MAMRVGCVTNAAQARAVPPWVPPWRFSSAAAQSAPPIGTAVNQSEKVSAVLPTDLHSRLVDRAREADRSVSAELRVAIREHVDAQPANGKREPKEKKR